MQRNRAKCAEGGSFKIDIGGDFNNQVLWNRNNFGMYGVICTGAGHAVTDAEAIAHAVPHSDHDAG